MEHRAALYSTGRLLVLHVNIGLVSYGKKTLAYFARPSVTKRKTFYIIFTGHRQTSGTAASSRTRKLPGFYLFYGKNC